MGRKASTEGLPRTKHLVQLEQHSSLSCGTPVGLPMMVPAAVGKCCHVVRGFARCWVLFATLHLFGVALFLRGRKHVAFTIWCLGASEHHQMWRAGPRSPTPLLTLPDVYSSC